MSGRTDVRKRTHPDVSISSDIIWASTENIRTNTSTDKWRHWWNIKAMKSGKVHRMVLTVSTETEAKWSSDSNVHKPFHHSRYRPELPCRKWWPCHSPCGCYSAVPSDCRYCNTQNGCDSSVLPTLPSHIKGTMNIVWYILIRIIWT